MATARGGGVGVSEVPRVSSAGGAGVLDGLVVSCFAIDFEFPLLLRLSESFTVPDFFFVLFGFGVGVWRWFFFDDRDFFDVGLVAACAPASSESFCRLSSLTCARRRPATNAPNASAIASQMRKRTTATTVTEQAQRSTPTAVIC
jgi:hypothetical protein